MAFIPWHQRPGAPASGTFLCLADALGESEARGFVFGEGKARFDMFIVRKNNEVYGYLNECPHALTPLETFTDRFFDVGKTHILCSTHGALFLPHNGACVAGPCAGKNLIPIAIKASPDKDGRLSLVIGAP